MPKSTPPEPILLVKTDYARLNYPTASAMSALGSASAVRLADFEGHRVSLEEAQEGLKLIEATAAGVLDFGSKETEHRVKRVVWAGTVLAYTRCFDSGPKHKLDAAEIYLELEHGIGIHQLIWDLRAKHFAHDINHLRKAFVGAAFDKNWAIIELVRAHSITSESDWLLNNMKILCKVAISYVGKNIVDLEIKLREEVAQMSVRERMALPTLKADPVAVKGLAKPRR